jgi:hypothetical protein
VPAFSGVEFSSARSPSEFWITTSLFFSVPAMHPNSGAVIDAISLLDAVRSTKYSVKTISYRKWRSTCGESSETLQLQQTLETTIMNGSPNRLDALTLTDSMLKWAIGSQPSSAKAIKARAAMMFPEVRHKLRFAKLTRLVASGDVQRHYGFGRVSYSRTAACADQVSYENPCLIEMTDIDVDKLMMDMDKA